MELVSQPWRFSSSSNSAWWRELLLLMVVVVGVLLNSWRPEHKDK